ncbi:MAG: histidine kinase [Alphaproteobacteria bacterium]
MTKFLVSEANPEGERLEDIFVAIRRDMIIRCAKISDDSRAEAMHVLNNNVAIMNLLSQAISLAEDSTHTLDKAFGPSKSAQGGEPRIGVA